MKATKLYKKIFQKKKKTKLPYKTFQERYFIEEHLKVNKICPQAQGYKLDSFWRKTMFMCKLTK